MQSDYDRCNGTPWSQSYRSLSQHDVLKQTFSRLALVALVHFGPGPMAAMAEKRRRIANLIALNNVSDTALCAMVDRLHEEPVVNDI